MGTDRIMTKIDSHTYPQFGDAITSRNDTYVFYICRYLKCICWEQEKGCDI